MKTVYVSFDENLLEKSFNRFPKTKKKRIRKKWNKLYFNMVPRKSLIITAIFADETISAVGHPNIKSKLEEVNNFGEQMFIFSKREGV